MQFGSLIRRFYSFKNEILIWGFGLVFYFQVLFLLLYEIPSAVQMLSIQAHVEVSKATQPSIIFLGYYYDDYKILSTLLFFLLPFLFIIPIHFLFKLFCKNNFREITRYRFVLWFSGFLFLFLMIFSSFLLERSLQITYLSIFRSLAK